MSEGAIYLLIVIAIVIIYIICNIRKNNFSFKNDASNPNDFVIKNNAVQPSASQIQQNTQLQGQSGQQQASQFQHLQPNLSQNMETAAGQVQNISSTSQASSSAFQNSSLQNSSLQNSSYRNNGSLDNVPSLKDGDGVGSACPSCGQTMVSFGRFGGYCSACNAWNYDRAAYLEKKALYGLAAETLFVLVAYENVHCRTQGQDYTGILYVMPGMLILKVNSDERLMIPFDNISAVSATKGAAQQLIVLVQGEDAQPISYNIDLKGASYDGAGGEDLFRIRQLIQER